MKLHQRLDYDRLAEVLGERGLVEPTALKHIMHECITSGQLPPEVLVSENLISDWELARVACETFNLAFLPIEVYKPSLNASTDIDVSFLHRYGLVPLDRFGKQLTVAMPVMVPAKILTDMAREYGLEVIPVVGCVGSNRRWLEENLTLQGQMGLTEGEDAPDVVEGGGAWAGIFDAGDAAVLLDLEGGEESSELSLDGLDALEDVVEAAEVLSSVIDAPDGLTLPSTDSSEIEILSDVETPDDSAPGSIDLPKIS